MRGTRIQNIVNELHGEKIDVVQWNPDLSFFIANSLSPAKVMNVMLNDEQGKTATVVVPDKQLSLAIGKEGQNARLAAKLTGWRIDIKSASEAAAETLQMIREDLAIRQRMAEKVEIFNLAASILAEKSPVDFSDGELNLLSEAIESVNLAQMALERERRAAAQAAKKAAQKDLLAEAEAILSGKSALKPGSPDKVEAVTEVEALEEALPEEVLPEAEAELLAEAEKLVASEPEEVAEAVVETEASPQEVEDIMAAAEAILAEPEVEKVQEQKQEEAVPATATWVVEEETFQPERFTAPTTRTGEWDEEIDLEDEKGADKKKARKKKPRLVYDERLGEVVAERRRKRKGRDDWFDFEDE
jgi:N utilization substance protein A